MDKEKLILVLESLANRNTEVGCANRFLFNDEAKAINEAVALLKDSVSIDDIADFLAKYAVPPEKLTHGYSIGDSKQAWIRFMRKNL